MKIMIKDIKAESDKTIVLAETDIGSIKGIWHNKELPEIGRIYHTELSINKFIKVISLSSKNSPACYIRDNEINFLGYCEDADEEVYYVRFCSDWLEMIEIPEGTTGSYIGKYVEFSAEYSNILFYPYNIY